MTFSYANGFTLNVRVNGNATTCGDSTTNAAFADLSEFKDDSGDTHYYTFVSHSEKWINAYNDAKTFYYEGHRGYLVTLEGENELEFITKLFKGYSSTADNLWVGGTSLTNKNSVKIADTESLVVSELSLPDYSGSSPYPSLYYWVCGPNAGTLISTGMWSSNEPNGYSLNESFKRQCVVSLSTQGKLDDDGFDTTGSTNYKTAGYFVEFGGYSTLTPGKNVSNDYNEHLKGEVTVTVDETAKVTLAYNGNGSDTESTVPTETTVFTGDNVTLAESGTMKKTGYIFLGWTKEATGPIEVTDSAPEDLLKPKSSYHVTENITLYAVWAMDANDDGNADYTEEKKYNICFNGNAGSEDSVNGLPDNITTVNGATVSKPSQEPTRGSFKFVGWYDDANCTTEHNWEQAVTSNTTVYAKWTVDVTFGIENGTWGDGGGSEDKTVTVQSDENGVARLSASQIPTDMEPDGYTFLGQNKRARETCEPRVLRRCS